MTTKNLWPDFSTSQDDQSSPKEVIRKAGNGLTEKTGGLVDFYPLGTSVENDRVDLTFSLWAPRLSYHFPFLKARFPVGMLYPVDISADRIQDPIRANDEDQLVEALSKIFNAQSTIETIQKLMSLSK